MGRTPFTHFTFTDVSNRSSQVLETALTRPVTLTKKNGKERLVIMPIAHYLAQFGERPQRSFSALTAPDEVHAKVLDLLDRALKEMDDEGEGEGRVLT